jgi:hemerythrin-like metal-binding protein
MLLARCAGGRASSFGSDGWYAMKQHRLMWAEEWTTSIAWLDDEHRELVDYYHAVVDALREDEVDVFLARLRDLREWLGRHFQNEEAALRRIGCRDAYRHRQDHQVFIDTLVDFSSNAERIYGHQERSAVARYIFYWLVRHGRTYDAKIISNDYQISAHANVSRVPAAPCSIVIEASRTGSVQA